MLSIHNSRGLTLIEVVISLVVISISLTLFVLSFINLTQNIRIEERTLQAINIVEFYQDLANTLQPEDCKKQQMNFIEFLCGHQEMITLELSQQPYHPFANGTLKVVKSTHESLTQLDYEMEGMQVAFSSKQWVKLP